MNDMESVLKVVADALKTMSKGIDNIARKVEKMEFASGEKKTAPPRKTRRRVVTTGKRRGNGTAIETVYGFIQTSDGINTAMLMKKTGYNEKKIHNIVYKLKKQGKIRTEKKGVYISV